MTPIMNKHNQFCVKYFIWNIKWSWFSRNSTSFVMWDEVWTLGRKGGRATSKVSKTNPNLLCFIRVIDDVIQGCFVICFTYRRLTLSVPISNLLGDVTNGVRCHKPRQIAPLILNLIIPNLFFFTSLKFFTVKYLKHD